METIPDEVLMKILIKCDNLFSLNTVSKRWYDICRSIMPFDTMKFSDKPTSKAMNHQEIESEWICGHIPKKVVVNFHESIPYWVVKNILIRKSPWPFDGFYFNDLETGKQYHIYDDMVAVYCYEDSIKVLTKNRVDDTVQYRIFKSLIYTK